MLGTLCFGGRRGDALTQCGGVSSTRKPPKHQSLKDNSQFQSCVLYSKSCNNPLRLTIQTDGLGQVSLLQGIFPTQGSNLGLSPCRWIFYQLSHQGSPLTYSIYKANAVYTWEAGIAELRLWAQNLDLNPGSTTQLRGLRQSTVFLCPSFRFYVI